MNALELQGLTKHYKDFTLGPLDLTLPGGTICGLIGENGAGKSTTIRLILDMVQRDGGTVTILGRDSRTASVRTKEEIGVVLGSEGIPPVPERGAGGQGDGGHLSELGRCRLCGAVPKVRSAGQKAI